MAKNSITDYSKTAASNTDIQSVDIAEGCLPSGINNAIREIMADLADMNDGTVSLTSPSFAAASITGALTSGSATVGSTASSAAVHSYTKLEVESSSHTALQLSGSTGGEQWIWFADDSSSTPVGGITYYHGGPYMGFRVEGSERMRIDSSGNVGIGTTSPSEELDINGDGSDVRIRMYDGAGASVGRIEHSGANFDISNTATSTATMTFTTGSGSGTERMRIDSSGNVGIGTTSPMVINGTTFSSGNHLHHTSSTHARIVASGSSSGQLLLNDTGASTNEKTKYIVSDGGSLQFGKTSDAGSNTEHMRIDGSGNLLVGTTDNLPVANNDASGIALRADGNAQFSRSGAATARFNRGTSDGEIVSFGKDGTSVGSIGAENAHIYLTGNGASAAGLRLQSNNIIVPMTNASISNGTVDLGYTDNRFKDLYLGGGVYLGGTGSANHLDDYEEGTWTPSYATNTGSFSSITYTEQNGTYVKIGRLVVVSFDLRTNSVSLGTASGPLLVTGLPFNINGTQGTAQCGAQNGWVTNAPEYWNPADGSNYGFLRRTNGANYSDITVSNLTTGSSTGANRILGCSIAYYTNS